MVKKVSRANLKTFVNKNNKLLYNIWLKKIKEQRIRNTTHQIKQIEKLNTNKTDTFSILLNLLSLERKVSKSQLTLIIKKVQTNHFSITDLFLKMILLEEIIEEQIIDKFAPQEYDISSFRSLLKNKLNRIFIIILEETSEKYEYVIERGSRGFCLLDNRGLIEFCNDELKKILGRKRIVGTKLEQYFLEIDGKKYVREAIKGKLGQKPGISFQEMLKINKKTISTSTEVTPIIITNRFRGAYATITDISGLIENRNKLNDQFPFGFVELNKKGILTYGNSIAAEILGSKRIIGRNYKEFVKGKKDRETAYQQLQKRAKGEADQFDITITRLDNGKRTPISVTAIPRIDFDGTAIGSTAIIKSKEFENTIDRINNLVGENKEGEQLLEEVAKELQKVIPFELFTLSLFSSDLNYARPVYEYSNFENKIWRNRWFRLTEESKKWMLQESVVISGNLRKLLSSPGFTEFKKIKEIQYLLKMGVKSLIFYPIYKDNKIIASITLHSNKTNYFNEDHGDIIKALPLDNVALRTYYLIQDENLQFKHSLLKELSSHSNDIFKLANSLVNRIVEHYNWENVALFRVDRENKLFRLLYQKSIGPFKTLKDYNQAIGAGVLGYVYKNKKSVKIDNIKNDQEFKDIFVDIWGITLSEICVPIFVDRKVSWLLVVEGSQEYAFSYDEVNSLEDVCSEVSNILNMAWLNNLLNVTLDSASDGVIVTGLKGKIKLVNEAICELLEYSRSEMLGTNIKDYLLDEDIKDAIFNAQKFPNDETLLKVNNDKVVNVLLSGSKSPDEFSSWIFVAKDLSLRRRIDELEYLKDLYNEISIQTTTPLSLAFSWLYNLRKNSNKVENIDLIDRTIQQLRKLQLTYERLAYYDRDTGSLPYNEILLNFTEIIRNVLDNLTREDIDKIKIVNDFKDEIIRLRGDLLRISFCFQTILSYLLMHLPESEYIEIRNYTSDNENKNYIITEFHGFLPELFNFESINISDQLSLSRTHSDIALGENVIKSFVEDNGGKYHGMDREGEFVLFRIDLPIINSG